MPALLVTRVLQLVVHLDLLVLQPSAAAAFFLRQSSDLRFPRSLPRRALLLSLGVLPVDWAVLVVKDGPAESAKAAPTAVSADASQAKDRISPPNRFGDRLS